MKHEKSCGTITIHDGKVLLIKQNRGYIGFPKGHVEQGESEIEAAVRETKEETNIDVIVNEKYKYMINYNVNDHINKDVIFYLAKPTSFEAIKQDVEIAEVMWVDVDKVMDLLSYDDTKEIFVQVLNDLGNLTI